MVVETTKIVTFQNFVSPRKEVDAFGKKVSWQALGFLLRIQTLILSSKLHNGDDTHEV
jgi:hypothetical protein